LGQGFTEKSLEKSDMSKILIAVVTCEKFQARAAAQQATWVPGIQGADVRFFLGKPSGICGKDFGDEIFCINNKDHNGECQYTGRDESHSVILNVPDDYKSLPYKVRAMHKWAIAHGYDKVLKLDDDTYLHPQRVMSAIPPQDYAGFLNATPPKPWCSGFCYWLSERALNITANAEIPPDEWAEDRWVGGVLFDHGIKPYWDRRYSLIVPGWRLPDFKTAVAICDCTGDNAHPSGGRGPKTLQELQEMCR
jgi:hypothetical protein